MSENLKENRLGEIRFNKDSLGKYKMKIIEYNNNRNIIIEFQDEYKAKVSTNYVNFQNGNIKNPYHPKIYNVGYIGQGRYKTYEGRKATISYSIWKDMLKRCYDPYYLNKRPTYINCYVNKEWYNFQNFAEWFEKNYYKIEEQLMCLDKDILCKGNKIYSPETCIFVPQRINNLFVKCDKLRGKYPIGVSITNRNQLMVQCSIIVDGKQIRKKIGYFPLDKPFQAFTCYKQFKENYIKQVADEYKDLIPKELYEALYKYEVEIND
jgi:hypothetical protein